MLVESSENSGRQHKGTPAKMQIQQQSVSNSDLKDGEFAAGFYGRHREGALVRSAASLLMWITAIPAYWVGLIGGRQFLGITLSVAFLVAINGPLVWLARRLRSNSHRDLLTIGIHGCEILGYTAIIHFAGGLEAAFLIPIYSSVVAYIGVVAPRRHLYYVAGMSAFAFCSLVMLEHLGIIPHYPLFGRFPDGNLPWPVASVMLAIVVSLLAVVAIISARTTETLKRSRERLRNQRHELEREVEARRASEQQLQMMVDEKEMLIKEVHHRVKNNLQVISSLLRLQAENIPDPTSRAALLASRHRVSSMSMVHEMFYQSGDLQGVELETFLRSLTVFLRSSYDLECGSVEVQIRVDPVQVNLDTAIRVGLVVNELVTNALKHAFLDQDTPGLLEISLRADEEHAELVVSDNGHGCEQDFNSSESSSLGLQLVKNLAKQLRGTIRLDTTNGTAVHLKFPVKDEVESLVVEQPASTLGR
jgi:two-component sensor histidine kinase